MVEQAHHQASLFPSSATIGVPPVQQVPCVNCPKLHISIREFAGAIDDQVKQIKLADYEKKAAEDKRLAEEAKDAEEMRLV